MKKFVSSIILASFTLASTVRAEVPSIPLPTTPPEEVDPGSALSPMSKGQKAPFTGVLLSPRAVATIISELNSTNEKLKIETDKIKNEQEALCKKTALDLKIKFETEKKLVVLDAEEKDRTINILQGRLSEEQKSRPNPAVWTAIGTAGGVALTLLTVFAVSQAAK